MKGYLTSYAALFREPSSEAPRIDKIEIPLIQRDYAQGRSDAAAEEIREDFLEVLLGAIAGGERVGLDFIYGKVEGRHLPPARRSAAADDPVPHPLVRRLAGGGAASRRRRIVDTLLLRDATERSPLLRVPRPASIAARSGVTGRVDPGPTLVPLHVAERPDDPVDAGHDRCDPRES